MTSWPTIRWSSADQVIATIDPDEDAPPPPPESAVDPAEWYHQLLAKGDTVNAILFIAHALPRYECVMWATRTLLDTRMIDRTHELPRAIMRWVDDPQDANRRRVQALLNTVPSTRPEFSLGYAVFMSGGTLGPAELPATLPGPDMTAKMAFAALIGAANKGDGKAIMRRAAELGEEIAAGGQGR